VSVDSSLMRSLFALAAILVVALAFGASTVAGQDSTTICNRYATALGLTQNTLMSALITRVVFGTNNAASTFGGVNGTFVALRVSPANQLDLISTANFATVSKTITLTGASDTLVGVARRPANGGFYFLGSSGQLYNASIDSVIINSAPSEGTISVALNPIGAAVAARAAAGAGAIGFNFNPVGDRIRITSTNQNFRINPDTGAAGNAGTATTSADGTDAGGSITYLGTAANTPSIVATAYTNLVGASPRNATATFGTVQYGIDTANNNFVRFADSNAGTIQGSGVALTGLASGSVLSSNVGLTVVSQAGGAGNVIVATVPTSSGSNAYTINPTTGAATQVSGALSGNAYIGITFTTAVNNFGVMQPKNTVAGIAGVPSLLPYFNLGIIFKQGQEDYTQGNALLSLRTKLVQFFGNTDALGCSNVDRPSPSAPSQYVVHKNMNITQELFDAFNGQVASAASSFGVSADDVILVGSFLNSFRASTFGTNSKAICTQPDCQCADGYSGTNCQTFTGTSTTSSGGQGNNGAAAGLTAPFLSLAALAVATMLAAMRA